MCPKRAPNKSQTVSLTCPQIYHYKWPSQNNFLKHVPNSPKYIPYLAQSMSQNLILGCLWDTFRSTSERERERKRERERSRTDVLLPHPWIQAFTCVCCRVGSSPQNSGGQKSWGGAQKTLEVAKGDHWSQTMMWSYNTRQISPLMVGGVHAHNPQCPVTRPSHDSHVCCCQALQFGASVGRCL